jgi:ferritin-like metal-binding protein YciE
MMESVEDRRNHILATIEANKNALNVLLDQAQAGGLNDRLRLHIKRTRQHIKNAKAVLTKLDARKARNLKNKTQQTAGWL